MKKYRKLVSREYGVSSVSKLQVIVAVLQLFDSVLVLITELLLLTKLK